MTERKGKAGGIDVKALLAGDAAFLREVVRAALQEVRADAEPARLSLRLLRTLITRVGKLELRVPQDRDGRFSTDPRT